ncbi:FAD dependent oxidoreductase [Pelotomaculum sp. FP]|uniref:FAD-dependent oxidoreductase n=1 Tax=Pelotomaculum sp. FP TaxID=261474 RepID=UPI001066F5A4|nr:FAD-dependent oxidoreductase [Pelotomaculum sp. FP]TEB16168.1 FAD dependent oxidoreductase [Pelotomaculum sp. FP]
MIYDKIIIGAGLYGLYAAEYCGKKGEKVLVLEYEKGPFARATYINQARIHNGYHYPRSFSTAIKSSRYFDRFNKDYNFCIHFNFRKVYATSTKYSWTCAKQFRKFCMDANIKCEDIMPELFFKPGMCDGVFDTEEYTYDAKILRDYFVAELTKMKNVEIHYGVRIERIIANKQDKLYEVHLKRGYKFLTGFLLNTTYSSVNQIISLLGFEPFRTKYELCELILCRVSDRIQDVGITVMDGPFFSIMPFGKTGLHSLTSVTFTPHSTSFAPLPTFECQKHNDVECSPQQLGNCNTCPRKPMSAWPYMSALVKKYLQDDIEIEYVDSLFSMKPILMASEIDDSRPTVIKQFSSAPTFISVLSGKINTMYDLEEVL